METAVATTEPGRDDPIVVSPGTYDECVETLGFLRRRADELARASVEITGHAIEVEAIIARLVPLASS